MHEVNHNDFNVKDSSVWIYIEAKTKILVDNLSHVSGMKHI